MRIQPRQRILEAWRSVADYSNSTGTWVWGGRAARNSISDAEQLLCILYPAVTVPALRLDRPDRTARDVQESLSALGDEVTIPRTLVGALTEYHETYRDDAGVPIFPGGSYFASGPEGESPNAVQQDWDVVDSMSMSITLTLATIGFVRVYRPTVRSRATVARTEYLEELASTRLTAALVGLLRSFSVRTMEIDSPEARLLRSMVNQSQDSDRRVTDELLGRLEEIRASLREELTIGSGQVAEELESPTRLFEVGWAWGLIEGAPEIETEAKVGHRWGVATDRPHLYFSSVALDGILDLSTERTRMLGLLNEEQQRLAGALQLRSEWTRSFWAILATLNQRDWPLEDVPWRTTDGEESEYFTLLATSMLLQNMAQSRGVLTGLDRAAALVRELATRGRIIRRPMAQDPGVLLHWPGVSIPLGGAGGDHGPELKWPLTSYSAMLLKRVLEVARLVETVEERRDLLDLADSLWDHLMQRRLAGSEPNGLGRNLWDQPTGVYPVASPGELPSWYHTERVVECLVIAAQMIDREPLVEPGLAEQAAALVAEAEHLFDRELLFGAGEAGRSMRDTFTAIGSSLRRARDLMTDRPGTAQVLAADVLRELDKLAAARGDRDWSR